MSVTTAVADGLLRVPLSLPVLTFKKVQHKHVKTAILKNNYCQKNSNFFSKDSRIARDLGLPDSTWMLLCRLQEERFLERGSLSGGQQGVVPPGLDADQRMYSPNWVLLRVRGY